MSRKLRLDESQTVRQGGVTITVKADPIEMEIDPLVIGKEPAEAIAKSIADGIRNVTQKVSPRTLARRRAMGIAGDKKWNATGELARTIRAEADGDGYAITAPPDRLQDPGMLGRLAEDVPAINNPVTQAVDAAIEHAADAAIKVTRR